MQSEESSSSSSSEEEKKPKKKSSHKDDPTKSKGSPPPPVKKKKEEPVVPTKQRDDHHKIPHHEHSSARDKKESTTKSHPERRGSRQRSRSKSRDRKPSDRDHRKKRSRSRSRRSRSRDRRRDRDRHRERRDKSKERRRKKSRSRERKSSRERERKSSKERKSSTSHKPSRRDDHRRSHRRSRSRDRPNRRRRRSRSKSREKRRRSRSPRSSKPHRISVSPEKPREKKMNYKEQLKQQLLEAQKNALDGKMSTGGALAMMDKIASMAGDKTGIVTESDKNLIAAAGDKATPQQALLQTMAAMHQKAQELTGVAVPKYYNPAAVNPLKYAEQVQKRKLLWSKSKDKEETQTVWKGTQFGAQNANEKFRKLMGIKGEDGHEAGPSSETPAAEGGAETMRKQQELFEHLDQEYSRARMTTHTHRGIGLGFSSQYSQPP